MPAPWTVPSRPTKAASADSVARVNSLSNLNQRLLTAAVLIAVFLAVLFYAPPLLWAAFVLLFLAGGAWEWAGLAKWPVAAKVPYAIATLVLAVLVDTAGWSGNMLPYLPALLFWILVVPLWLKNAWPAPKGPAAALIGWFVLLPTYLALILLREQGAQLLLAAICIAIVADSAAYFTGRAFGRHKLAPSISPGKTWEGVLGGATGVLLFGLLLTPPETVDRALFLLAMLLLFALSVLGDLFESWIKRQAGVKDSSQLLPGHGGVLDRIDSQLAVLPAAALLWILLT